MIVGNENYDWEELEKASHVGYESLPTYSSVANTFYCCLPKLELMYRLSCVVTISCVTRPGTVAQMGFTIIYYVDTIQYNMASWCQ